jgi:hypothetical protein
MSNTNNETLMMVASLLSTPALAYTPLQIGAQIGLVGTSEALQRHFEVHGDDGTDPETAALAMLLSTMTGHPSRPFLDLRESYQPGQVEDALATLIAQACKVLPKEFTDAMVEEFSSAPSIEN